MNRLPESKLIFTAHSLHTRYFEFVAFLTTTTCASRVVMARLGCAFAGINNHRSAGDAASKQVGSGT